MTQIYYEYLSGPVGKFLVAGTDEALCFTGFTTGHQQRAPQTDWRRDASALRYATAPLLAYFAGERVAFDIPLNPVGTAFQLEVWRALQQVEYGQTTTYGELARALGRPQAYRAVGAANGANHLPIVIPCHRVIGADGSLTGFGGGLDAKTRLLELEGVLTRNDQSRLFA